MTIFTTLAVQSWTLYAISISVILSRFIFRRIILGHIKKLQADDWLMLAILMPYTASVVLANQVGYAETTMERKFRYVLVEMQIITMWLVKASLLVLYWRIFPIETSTTKRRLIKSVALFCATSFLIIQVSLMLWCHPTKHYWTPTPPNPQCTSYHNHTAISLSLSLINTMLIMLAPIPFIPTPRRTLLAILILFGILVLTTTVGASATILTSPSSPTYLHWDTAESSSSIIFANLPFLTSLVVTAAPARFRKSMHVPLSTWPRSRRESWECTHTQSALPPYRSRSCSDATAVSEMPSPCTKGSAWAAKGRDESARNSASSSPASERPTSPMLPPPVTRRPLTGEGEVPKMRLSGGLAEMGDFTVQSTQGWPTYWK